MARVTTKETTVADQAWEEYFAIQLTPEQKAAGRAELEKRVEEAAAAWVYDRVMELVGKVHLDLDLDELREDRD